jgi:hypothetical protein
MWQVVAELSTTLCFSCGSTHLPDLPLHIWTVQQPRPLWQKRVGEEVRLL